MNVLGGAVISGTVTLIAQVPVLPFVGEEMGDERSRSGIIILSAGCGRGELQNFLEEY